MATGGLPGTGGAVSSFENQPWPAADAAMNECTTSLLLSRRFAMPLSVAVRQTQLLFF